MRVQMRGTQRELSERAGVNEGTISRWLSDAVPDPRDVIKFARNLGQSPVEALVMAGYLTPDEANVVVSELSLSDFDEIVLLDELKRRAVLRAQR